MNSPLYVAVDIETLGTEFDSAPITEVSYITFLIDKTHLYIKEYNKAKIALETIPYSLAVDVQTLAWRLNHAPDLAGGTERHDTTIDHIANMLVTANFILTRGHFDIPIIENNYNVIQDEDTPELKLKYTKFIDARTLSNIPKVKAAILKNPNPHDSLYDALHNVIVMAEAYDLVIDTTECPQLQSLLITFGLR